MLKNMNLKKLFIMTLIITLSITTLTGIIAFISGEMGELQGKIIGTSLLFGYHSVLLLVAANLFEKTKNKFAYVSGGLAILGFIYSNLIVWEVIDFIFGAEIYGRIMMTLAITPLASAVASILLTLKTETKASLYVKSVTLSLIGVVVIMVLMPTWEIISEELFTQEFYFKSLIVYLMLAILGVVITPLLIKFSKVK